MKVVVVPIDLTPVLARLDLHTRLLRRLLEGDEAMALDLTALTASAAENRDVVQSALVVLQELASEVGANAHDQQAVNDIAAQIGATAQSLAEAIANVPEPPAGDASGGDSADTGDATGDGG